MVSQTKIQYVVAIAFSTYIHMPTKHFIGMPDIASVLELTWNKSGDEKPSGRYEPRYPRLG